MAEQLKKNKLSAKYENQQQSLMATYHIREYMQENNITYGQLADAIGVTRSAISRWMNSRIPANQCHVVADYFDGIFTVKEIRPDVFK